MPINAAVARSRKGHRSPRVARPLKQTALLAKTHQHVPTGIETDVQSLQAAWKAMLKVKCPHCGEMHEVSVRETYLNGALDDATDRLRSV